MRISNKLRKEQWGEATHWKISQKNKSLFWKHKTYHSWQEGDYQELRTRQPLTAKQQKASFPISEDLCATEGTSLREAEPTTFCCTELQHPGKRWLKANPSHLQACDLAIGEGTPLLTKQKQSPSKPVENQISLGSLTTPPHSVFIFLMCKRTNMNLSSDLESLPCCSPQCCSQTWLFPCTRGVAIAAKRWARLQGSLCCLLLALPFLFRGQDWVSTHQFVFYSLFIIVVIEKIQILHCPGT